jgi:hypothetical protein
VNEPSRSIKDLTSRIPPLDAANAEDAFVSDSGKATQEALAYAGRNLEEISADNEHQRNEYLKDTVHKLAAYGNGVFLLYVFSVFAVSWHYLLPSS